MTLLVCYVMADRYLARREQASPSVCIAADCHCLRRRRSVRRPDLSAILLALCVYVSAMSLKAGV
jgi:hypothetical protein